MDNNSIDLEKFIPNEPTSLKELENFLKLIDTSTVYNGGPSPKRYSNTYSECAYKENGFWRHKNCPRVFIDNKRSSVGDFCSTVNKKIHLLPNSESTDAKYIRMDEVNLTPHSRRRTKILKQSRNHKRKLLSKKQKQLLKLQDELSCCQEKMKSMNVENLENINNILKDRKVPDEQV